MKVLLEPGVWLIDDGSDGDPARTTNVDNATEFPTIKEAAGGLEEARTYRPFKNAEFVEDHF